ncbi:MAG: aminoacyl-histidine dipeptidase [Planctomycetes bacterium]|nr:aminoacyl-histidine dipeptidase [Planctomycetota bacterium]
MTESILRWFRAINRIPRGSKNEKAISDWLAAWAGEHGFASRRDAVLNLVIEVPGTPGLEGAPTVVVQGHMDMVCEKAKGSRHDFTTDPIEPIIDGDWMRADNTTLGADNGIALAMAMTVATARNVPHPPLELLFTVDEETGLTGANALENGFIRGKILLNLDSEDEGVFTVGCAGGRDTHLHLPLQTAAPSPDHSPFKITVGGLRGGHSGIDIQRQRGNAVRILGRALDQVLARCDARLVSIQGGSAHNAIPRDAEAVVMLPAGEVDRVGPVIGALERSLRAELARVDPGISLSLEAVTESPAGPAWSAQTTRTAVDLLLAIPHGVAALSTEIAGLVETSNNLATVVTANGEMVVQTSQRSSIMQCLDFLTHRIESVGRLAGAKARSNTGYPSWQPNMASPLLAQCKRLYRELFDKDPVVEIIHAGLECGIIGSKYEGMDMISFGPTIVDPHSPNERIEISSIGKVWDFFTALLARLK